MLTAILMESRLDIMQQMRQSGAMQLKTRVFELCKGRYANLSGLAQAMGLSVRNIYWVRQGRRGITEKFIAGAMKAFPGHSLDDLFYVQETEGDKTPDRPDDGCRELIMNLLLWRPDLPIAHIADIAGCSRQRVYQVANTVGLTRNTNPRNYRSDVTVERVLELYHQGLLERDIAQALNCNQITVRKRLRAVGITKSQCYSRSMKLDWRGSPKIRAQMT